MPRIKYLIPADGDRVRLTRADSEGRTGEILGRDPDGSFLVEVDAVSVPWMPGYTARCDLGDFEALDA